MKFSVGQRVRILPCRGYPPIKTTRYGIVQAVTDHPGMCLMDKERPSVKGEWAYVVASFHHPKAGALWFSGDGIEPMRRPKQPKI